MKVQKALQVIVLPLFNPDLKACYQKQRALVVRHRPEGLQQYRREQKQTQSKLN